MGMGGIIDILFLVSGVYLIGTALMAKTQGAISANVMLGKNTNEKDITDKAGFIEYMYKRILLAGLLITAASIVHLANDYYIGSNLLTWVGISVMLIAIIIYAAAYKKGQEMYMIHKKENDIKSKIDKK